MIRSAISWLVTTCLLLGAAGPLTEAPARSSCCCVADRCHCGHAHDGEDSPAGRLVLRAQSCRPGCGRVAVSSSGSAHVLPVQLPVAARAVAIGTLPRVAAAVRTCETLGRPESRGPPAA